MADWQKLAVDYQAGALPPPVRAEYEKALQAGMVPEPFRPAGVWPKMDVSSGLPAGQRAKLSFAPSKADKVSYLKRLYPEAEVIDSPRGMALAMPGKPPLLIDEATFSARDFADLAGGTPEVLGSVLGGVAGAALGGPTPMAAATEPIGAATGGMAGEVLRRKIGEKLDVPQEGAPDLEEVALRNAVGAAAGRTGVGLVLGNRTTPAMREVAKAAAEENVPITRSALSGSSAGELAESGIGALPGGNLVLRANARKTMEALGKGADDYLPGTGGLTAEESGRSATTAFITRQREFKNVADTLAAQVKQAGNPTLKFPSTLNMVQSIINDKGMQVRYPELVSVLQEDILPKLLRKGTPPAPSIVLGPNGMPVMSPGTPSGPQGLDFPLMQDIRGKLGSMVDAAKSRAKQGMVPDKDVGTWKRLFGEFSGEMDAGLSQHSPQVAQAYETFRKFYRFGEEPGGGKVAGKLLYGSKMGRELASRLDEVVGQRGVKGFDSFAEELFRRSNLSRVKAAQLFFGDEAMRDLALRKVTAVMEKSARKTTLPGGKEATAVNWQTVENQFKEIAPELKLIVPDIMARLDRLTMLARKTGQAARLTGNTSRTAPTAFAGGAVAATALSGDWSRAAQLALAYMAAPAALASLLVNPLPRQIARLDAPLAQLIRQGSRSMATATIPGLLKEEPSESGASRQLNSKRNPR